MSGAGAPRCIDCHERLASVLCCGEALCLLHAHCTRHAQHPTAWKITDRAEHARSLPEVQALREAAILSIEHDLAEEERRRQGQSATPAIAAAAATSSAPPKPQMVVCKPSLPTFAAIRKRAMENAQKRRQPAQLSTAATAELVDDAPDCAHREAGTVDNLTEESANSKRPRQREIMFQLPGDVPMSPELFQSLPDAPAKNSAKRARSSDGGENSAVEEGEEEAAKQGDAGPPSAAAEPLEGDKSDRQLRNNVTTLLAEALRGGFLSDSSSQSGAAAARPGASPSMLTARADRELAPVGGMLSLAGLRALAAAIEAGVFSAVGLSHATPAYRQHARALALALRDRGHAALRARLAAGELAPAVLAALPAADLASDAVKEHQRSVEEIVHRQVTVGLWRPAPPSVTCASAACVEAATADRRSSSSSYEGSNSSNMFPAATAAAALQVAAVEYMLIFDRRDIRKAEVWGSADADDSRYRLRCRSCGSEWFSEGIL